MDTTALVDSLLVLGFRNGAEPGMGAQWWVNPSLGMTVTFDDVPSPSRIHTRFPWSHVHAVASLDVATAFFRAAASQVVKDAQA
jgi:hypothetical protein